MGRTSRRDDHHFKGGTMTKMILYFTEPEMKLINKVQRATGLPYHDLLIRAVRGYDRNHRR